MHGRLRALLLDDDQADEPNVDANPNQDEAQQPDHANINQRQEADQLAVENMTWQRLLGLDGTFAFIENVFWVISLNFGFHVVFCKFPDFVKQILTNGFQCLARRLSAPDCSIG